MCHGPDMKHVHKVSLIFSANGEQIRYELAIDEKQVWVCVCQRHAEQLQKQTRKVPHKTICLKTWLEKVIDYSGQ